MALIDVRVVGKGGLPKMLRHSDGWSEVMGAFRTPRRRLLQHTIFVASFLLLLAMIHVIAMIGVPVLSRYGFTFGNTVWGWVNLAIAGFGAGCLVSVLWTTVYWVWPTTWAVRRGLTPLCRECLHRLDGLPGEMVRCPECGTENDATKWLIRLECAEGESESCGVG